MLYKKNIFFNHNLLALFLFVSLSYPLFYFAYKFCLPDFGGQDFYTYYCVYKDWNFDNVMCPHNMRIISGFFIYLMNKIGLYYDTEVVFTTFYPEFDQQVFFNAVFFNYICVAFTCLMIYHLVLWDSKNKIFSFFAGCVYLFGFGTLFFSLKPLTESCGILLLAITFYYYVKQSNFIYVLLCISLFQREYIFIVFGILSVVDIYFIPKQLRFPKFIHTLLFDISRKRQKTVFFQDNKAKYYFGVLFASVLLFVIFLILRKTLFHTPHFDYQISILAMIDALRNVSSLNWLSFIKQSILVSNLFFLYCALLLYKHYVHLSINKNYFIKIILLLLQILIMGILIQGAENMGRIFYYTTPILIFYLFVELKSLLYQRRFNLQNL